MENVDCPQSFKIMPLLDETLILLKTRPVTLELKQIAKAIDVSPNWLSMLNKGKIDNPGIVGIQKLHDYLVSKKKEQPQLSMLSNT